MKKINIFFILILIILICGTVYLYRLKSSPFEEIVSLNEEKITSIEVRHGDKRIILTDKNEIENIMDDFSKMDLRKSKLSDSKYLYLITIKVNDEPKFDLQIRDNNYIHIYNFDTEPNDKDHSIEYKIINEIDFEDIYNLFNV